MRKAVDVFSIRIQENMPFLRHFVKRQPLLINESQTLGFKILEPLYVAALIATIFFLPQYSRTSYAAGLVVWSVIIAMLFSLAYVNKQSMMLPNKLQLPILFTALIYVCFKAIMHDSGLIILDSLLGATVTFLVPYAIFMFSNGKWIGGGVPKFGFIAGLLLGFQAALAYVLVITIIVFCKALIAHFTKRLTENVPIGWALVFSLIVVEVIFRHINS